MATCIVMTIMVTVTVDANAHADATDMNADDGGVSGRTQQRKGKNRGEKGFHRNSLSNGAEGLFRRSRRGWSHRNMEMQALTGRSKTYN
jgi:hypothetical protein